jgi:hypothetical protein
MEMNNKNIKPNQKNMDVLTYCESQNEAQPFFLIDQNAHTHTEEKAKFIIIYSERSFNT